MRDRGQSTVCMYDCMHPLDQQLAAGLHTDIVFQSLISLKLHLVPKMNTSTINQITAHINKFHVGTMILFLFQTVMS